MAVGNKAAVAQFIARIADHTFIDLFAGIGGFRIALESFGLKCVYSSEWDTHAQITYQENFGEVPEGDITKINTEDIPKHNVLCAGFPCQAFSISGKQKGFADTRGTLFFEIARIAEHHKPEVLFLENVRNFARHDNGRTLRVVKETLDRLDYQVFDSVLNSSHYGVPQSRRRIYLVCFRKDLDVIDFRFPHPQHEPVKLRDFLESDWQTDRYVITHRKAKLVKPPPKPNIFGYYPQKPIRVGTIGNAGQGERIYSDLGHAITLSAYGGGVASKTGAYLVNGKVRKLSPRECARIMGFPDSFKIPVTDAQAYKQFGNSVVIPVLQAIFREIVPVLDKEKGIMQNDKLRALGSKTAKDGFKRERLVVDKFNNWGSDKDAQQWLEKMGYPINEIERVTAVLLRRQKADVQVRITVYTKDAVGVENLSVKLVSNSQGFNQIDKRQVDTYAKMWNIPPAVVKSLKLYTGAIHPTRGGLKDNRRMYLHEMAPQQRQGIIDFYTENKVLVVSDIIKGTGPFSAGWMLVILTTTEGDSWALKSINHAMNIFAQGAVAANKNGNLYIGRILMQRKGGDAGRSTATMLQFKINPVALFGD